jgi:hypothetical protein
MDNAEKIALKQRLKRWALDTIGERITVSRSAIDQAQQSANQEEKSSAGDKYETGRAMGQLQKDMYARQLAESIKELATLHAVKTDTLYTAPGPGAFVRGEGFAIFIAAGLGKQQWEGQTIFFLSPIAPLAQALRDKKPGESVVFNGAPIIILEIF